MPSRKYRKKDKSSRSRKNKRKTDKSSRSRKVSKEARRRIALEKLRALAIAQKSKANDKRNRSRFLRHAELLLAFA